MSEYTHRSKAFQELVLCAPFMVAEMAKHAEKIRDRAEATAPDAPPYGEGYKYRFVASSGIGPRPAGNHDVTAYGQVTNEDPDAFLIEFGTEDTPRHRTLGKAIGHNT